MEVGYKFNPGSVKDLLTLEVICTNKKTTLANALIQYRSGIDTLINYDIKFFSNNEKSLFDIILEDCSINLKILKYFYLKRKNKIIENIIYYLKKESFDSHFDELIDIMINNTFNKTISNKYIYILKQLKIEYESKNLHSKDFILIYTNSSREYTFWQQSLWEYYNKKDKIYFHFAKEALQLLYTELTETKNHNLYNLFDFSISWYETKNKYESIRIYNLLVPYYNITFKS